MKRPKRTIQRTRKRPTLAEVLARLRKRKPVHLRISAAQAVREERERETYIPRSSS